MKAIVQGRAKAATRNLTPGRATYGEPLFMLDGAEHRAWNPYRSKLAAYICKGGAASSFPDDTVVVYLGAAQGTTVTHVSDLVPDGLVVAVEKSPRASLALLHAIEARPNVVPAVADARRPGEYARIAPGRVDVLYQDVAQADQVDIFLRNAARFGARLGYLCLKARSVAVEEKPRDIFERSRAAIQAAGHEVVELMTLEPFQRDHAMLTVRFAHAPGA